MRCISQPSSGSNASFEPVSWSGHPFGHGALYYGLRVTCFPAARSRFGSGPWQSHVGAGLGFFLPHTEGEVDGVAVTGDYQYGGLGWQVFGGAEYALARNLLPWRAPRVALLLEGKFDSGTLEVRVHPATRIETHTAAFHLIGGIALHF